MWHIHIQSNLQRHWTPIIQRYIALYLASLEEAYESGRIQFSEVADTENGKHLYLLEIAIQFSDDKDMRFFTRRSDGIDALEQAMARSKRELVRKLARRM